MKICVYCSASNAIADHYKNMAARLGRWIAENGHTLVYGGATGGLMSAVADAAAQAGAAVIGIIPVSVMRRKATLPMETIEVADLNERKKRMKEQADVFVVLPGSYGTLDEMFDAMAAGTVGEHRKPLILVNENNFYGDLLSLIDRMRKEAFIPAQEHYKPMVAGNIEECIRMIINL